MSSLIKFEELFELNPRYYDINNCPDNYIYSEKKKDEYRLKLLMQEYEKMLLEKIRDSTNYEQALILNQNSNQIFLESQENSDPRHQDEYCGLLKIVFGEDNNSRRELMEEDISMKGHFESDSFDVSLMGEDIFMKWYHS